MSEMKNQLPVAHHRRPLEPVDPLRRYVQEVSRYPFLSPLEERELAVAFRKTGDREAARKLVMAHLRLVVKIAHEYHNAYSNLLDLIQEGNLGLMRAVKSFDPKKGVRLGHYASGWIRSFILKYILDNFRLIKIGTTQAQRRIFFNLMKEKERIEKKGFKPDTKGLAAAMEVKPEEVEEMTLRLTSPELSLDAPLQSDEDKRHIDFLEAETQAPEESIDRAQFKDILETKLKEFATTLNERETKIFQERLLAEVPLTLQAIADQYGVSRERARQIEERIKEKLKDYFQKEGIQVQDHLSV